MWPWREDPPLALGWIADALAKERPLRVLLINPAYPETYWSLKHMLPMVDRRWLVPPLGLITVAALLPRGWECRLIDLNIEELEDADLQAADCVLLSGMLVQRASMHAVLARCRRLGVRTVVGGPYASALPEKLAKDDQFSSLASVLT